MHQTDAEPQHWPKVHVGIRLAPHAVKSQPAHAAVTAPAAERDQPMHAIILCYLRFLEDQGHL